MFKNFILLLLAITANLVKTKDAKLWVFQVKLMTAKPPNQQEMPESLRLFKAKRLFLVFNCAFIALPF
ncbi:exported hypothetical protein [Candidatus Desulfosporosinus infrequens]|uniref:Uncharacterized protein n=1 Tax=Candidatus Desulfosporosinus infrequens TaxID=2043169 RepID=A0A2U3KVV9_9FIRM|nr:exported hypothetical protein [Candidatus Desulfosporosinus infrequens]